MLRELPNVSKLNMRNSSQLSPSRTQSRRDPSTWHQSCSAVVTWTLRLTRQITC
ncbi:hypothetical protein DPMN_101853 [Dreissena polymorpha]|uniref:Uncharacterized protein n=1 Tax=Dreissena polymorpha TaxID=45954 RepID=A0A9D4LKJ8_DREPO|nr:hypothetical protein DPMN_101853 [Dreissena polymorpha]